MSSYHRDTAGHLHDVRYNNDTERLEPVAGFDWESVCNNIDGESISEDRVEFADMVASFSLLLQWACKGASLANVGARVSSLLCLLDPVNAPHGRNTLVAIAKEAGCTKALLSRELMKLRDEVGIHLTLGKLGSARASYRKAQIESIEAGKHSCHVRKDLNPERQHQKEKRREASGS
jgi:hypothetical protein